jgi:antitoxin component HigA of HigAB toxin-antitoxin module
MMRETKSNHFRATTLPTEFVDEEHLAARNPEPVATIEAMMERAQFEKDQLFYQWSSITNAQEVTKFPISAA